MSCSGYLLVYVFMDSGVQHILCCIFCVVFLRLVASFSGFHIFDCPFKSLLSIASLHVSQYISYSDILKHVSQSQFVNRRQWEDRK